VNYLDGTTFRILDTLTRGLGTELSIKALTEKIGELYGSAYYVNIYKKLQQLAQEGIVSLTRMGNSLIVGLNFKEYMITDLLTEVEFRNKQTLLRDHRELQMLFLELETYCRDLLFVRSISTIKPHKNAKLNRAELLFLIRAHGMSFHHDEKETEALRNMILRLQAIRNMKIDFLILTDVKLLDMLSSDEINPLKEMISDKIVFFNPQHFWMAIKVAAERNIPVRAEEKEISPAKIPEQDLVYNLARFGYKEMGTQTPAHGRDICIEYIATALIAQGDARRIEAVPVILAKNSVNFDILFFLSQKYRLSERMSGLLKILHEAVPRKDSEAVIKAMEAMKIKEIPADRESILEKMRYNAT
jgi:hypothetical protein